jgi:hypothetical protein
MLSLRGRAARAAAPAGAAAAGPVPPSLRRDPMTTWCPGPEARRSDRTPLARGPITLSDRASLPSQGQRARSPLWSISRSARIKVVTVPDLDVLLPCEGQHRPVILLSCTARPGAGGQGLPHMPVDRATGC